MKCIIVECENESFNKFPGCSKNHIWLAKQRAITIQDAFSATKSNLDIAWYEQCKAGRPELNWAKPPRMDFTVEEAKAYSRFQD